MSRLITVSICMITYNHEKFISKSIEGVMMQQTNFSFQLVIGEDCSTDNTRQICEKYAKQYPEKIKLLPEPDKNLGLMSNFLRTLEACDSKYIAICEGDDYWTDSLILQKQVDFLDKNKDFCGSSHNVRYLNNKQKTKFHPQKETVNLNRKAGPISIKESLTINIVHSSSLIFRNSCIAFPDYYKNIRLHDEFLFMMVCKNGGMYYLPETMSTYRLHDDCLTNLYGDLTFHINRIQDLKYTDEYLDYKYSKLISQIKSHQYLAIAMKSTGINTRFSNLRKAIYHNPAFLKTHLRSILSIVYRSFKPKK